MKLQQLLLASVVTASVCAGQTTSTASTSGSSLGDWFVGTSFGQFVDNDGSVGGTNGEIDLNMYTLHVGRSLNQQVLGCDLAAYFEIGMLNGDAASQYDVDIVPLTLNLSAEKELFAGIKGYATGGLGYAFTTVSDIAPGTNAGSGGFYAQASLGLSYDVNEDWEIYGGARYLFLGDVDFGLPDSRLDDNVGYEVGLRYNF